MIFKPDTGVQVNVIYLSLEKALKSLKKSKESRKKRKMWLGILQGVRKSVNLYTGLMCELHCLLSEKLEI